MAYYLRYDGNGLHAALWKIDDGTAVRMGVSNPESGAGTYFQAEHEETIWECMRRKTPWFGPDGASPFHKLQLDPGQYYPRMARPRHPSPDVSCGNPGIALEAEAIAIGRGQLGALTLQLERICQTVHPTTTTLGVYGHDIRNLLILACTEVEAHWRGVLAANKYPASRHTTQDYVKLCRPMKLDEYKVSFSSFPWLPPIYPFHGWGSTGRPTEELDWYDAYNAVKHNREAEFSKATLDRALKAVAACLVLMTAQFGPLFVGAHSPVHAFFALSDVPDWPLSDVYVFPLDGSPCSPVSYPFP